MRQQALVCDRAVESQRRWRRINGRRVWWRAGASLGALAVLLGGCPGTDSAEPAEPTSPEEATVPDESETGASGEETAAGPPEVDPPERPDIERDDDIGAQNAAEYFVELHSYIHSGGDIALYEQLSAPDCESCTAVAEEVRRMRDAGEYREGGEVEIFDSEVFPPDSENPSHLVRIDMRESPGVNRDINGQEISHFDGGRVIVDVLARHSSERGGWEIEGVSASAR